jgi:hypothetical protein
MKKILLLIFLITTLTPACCPMVSVNPLSEPDGIDERLFGVWRPVTKSGEKVYLHIGKASDATMLALSVEHLDNGRLDTARMPFFLTRTGKNDYWNMRYEDLDDSLAKGYVGFFFMKYVLADSDTLLVYQLERKPVVAAIQAGELQGQVTYKAPEASRGAQTKPLPVDKNVDCITISDSSANLLNFLEIGDSQVLFPEPMRFIRARLEAR